MWSAVTDKKPLQELKHSIYVAAVLQTLNLEAMHFQTYGDINYL
jgi:hypothetical protein